MTKTCSKSFIYLINGSWPVCSSHSFDIFDVLSLKRLNITLRYTEMALGDEVAVVNVSRSFKHCKTN